MRMLIPIKPVTSVAYGFGHTTVAVSDVEEDKQDEQLQTRNKKIIYDTTNYVNTWTRQRQDG
jgi:hypothetical protein